jgi:hypothetical protein
MVLSGALLAACSGKTERPCRTATFESRIFLV